MRLCRSLSTLRWCWFHWTIARTCTAYCRAFGRYGVSVLAENQQVLSNHFAGHTVEGLHIRFTTRKDIPLLEGAVAYFVVQVIDAHPAGDHSLYIGRVEHFESRDDKPLLFYAGKYQQLGIAETEAYALASKTNSRYSRSAASIRQSPKPGES